MVEKQAIRRRRGGKVGEGGRLGDAMLGYGKWRGRAVGRVIVLTHLRTCLLSLQRCRHSMLWYEK